MTFDEIGCPRQIGARSFIVHTGASSVAPLRQGRPIAV